MLFSQPVAPLPKIQAPTAAAVTAKFTPSPAAQALLKPEQTPAEYVATLEQHKQSADAVNMLAHGMPERESTWWACQSCERVSGKLNPADQSALAAAKSWVKNPTPETQATAAAAAAKTDYTGPGGWAAQSAAWSKPAPSASLAPTPSIGLVGPAAPNLAGAAVAGAVLLAAGLVNRPPMPAVPAKPALPAIPSLPTVPTIAPPTVPTIAAAAPTIPPVDVEKQSKMLQPFLDLGKDVASGKNTWA